MSILSLLPHPFNLLIFAFVKFRIQYKFDIYSRSSSSSSLQFTPMKYLRWVQRNAIWERFGVLLSAKRNITDGKLQFCAYK